MTTQEILSKGLDWQVQKKPLVSTTGDKTQSYGLFKEGAQWLSTVGERYEIVQNSALANIIVLACQELKLSPVNAGQLQEGRKVFIQIKLEDEAIGQSGLKRYLTALNGHGTVALGFGSSSVNIICENTFHRALKQVAHFRHTASVLERVKQAAAGISHSIKEEQEVIRTFGKMANYDLATAMVDNLIEEVFGAPESSRGTNIIYSVKQAIDLETSRQGNTLWGAFNGITYYSNHVKKNKSVQDSVMAGGGYDINNKAFRFLEAQLS